MSAKRGHRKIAEELQARLEKLSLEVRQIERDRREPVPADFAEQATAREGEEVLADLAQADLAEIEQIRKALARIEAGTYGICDSCGEPIAEKRLAALPYATTCIECAK